MQFFGIEDIKDLTKASQTTIEWASGSNLRIGGQAYSVTSVLTLDTATDIDTGAIASDTIYYIYAVVVAGTVSLKYSLSSSAPTGYSAYRLIGSFGTDDISEISGTSNKDQGKVGDVIHSMLTEEQFIAENGAGWVLADGRDVTGSKYDTLILNGLGGNIPDMRGQFLRGKNNTRLDGNEDPDGERDLGNAQGDAMRDHSHQASNLINAYPRGPSTFGGVGIYGAGTTSTTDKTSSPLGPGGDNTWLPVSGENRPKNVAVNIFIKIEDIQV
jgi:hypothetical protein